ncbi:hypothetical protein J5X84_05045 [Streptosporangiaceae bacterium NEAU-GS5]|nr:hypothetical protein [Streptosporangiaceae bacterium NEAU-GS5]
MTTEIMTTETFRRRSPIVAAVVLAIAAPIGVWGLIGRLDSPGVPVAERDYILRPWDIAPDVEHALTIGSCVLAVLATAYLTAAAVRGAVGRRWLLWVLLPVVLAGVSAAVLQRMVTSGGAGANIGGGFAILTLIPFIAAMLVVAVVDALRLRSRARA